MLQVQTAFMIIIGGVVESSRTNASTVDTTPTITASISMNDSACAISTDDHNYSTMLSGTHDNCSTINDKTTCTLSAGNALSIGSHTLYISSECTDCVERSEADSGILPILIRTIPSQPNLTFPTNGTSLVYNDSNIWSWLNWTNSTDGDNDSFSFLVYVDDINVANTTELSYNYSFSKPAVGGQEYNWTVITNDGEFNSSNEYFYFTLVPETHLYLDGV